jgi:hypothetical protein
LLFPAPPTSCRRGAPDLALFLALAALTGWQQQRLTDPRLAATLLLPNNDAIQAFLLEQAGFFCWDRAPSVKGETLMTLLMTAPCMWASSFLVWSLRCSQARPGGWLHACPCAMHCIATLALFLVRGILTCTASPCTAPVPQGLNSSNVYLYSRQLESLLAYHALPQPLRRGPCLCSRP